MVSLDGSRLSLHEVHQVSTDNAPVEIASQAIAAMQTLPRRGGAARIRRRTRLRRQHRRRVAGRCSRSAGELEQLQRNVVRSHACGVGDPLARDEVRAMMLIRANVLAKGFSGIRPVVAQRLCDLLNRGVTPVVPSQGSVGASGDLAPLAHIALVLIGEGEAEFEGDSLYPAPKRCGAPASSPSCWHPKKAFRCVNGTQAMLAVGCLELLHARNSGRMPPM